ncbi:MAG: hypothetical protein ACI4XQ_01020 [Eubacteriales bacterium]
MPYPKFDRSKLSILPLDERVSDIDLSVMVDPEAPPPPFENPKLDAVADAVVRSKKLGASSILMYGAHVIRSGCGPWMIKLAENGLVTHFATNGAGSIHDFEFSLKGYTCESVAKYISEGQFGLWKETGIINDILRDGVRDGLGAGEAIGRYIWENDLPYKKYSVLGNAYRLGIPATVHIGVGNDIIHEHPNCDGAVLGEASYTDFLVYANSIAGLEHGTFLNFGSAVAGPEVYLKCLAMARNVARREGRSIYDITTAVFDLLDIEDDDYSVTPPKSDPRYYFRPWKTILARTTADGGKSFYVRGTHRETLPNLAKKIFDRYGL